MNTEHVEVTFLLGHPVLMANTLLVDPVIIFMSKQVSLPSVRKCQKNVKLQGIPQRQWLLYE